MQSATLSDIVSVATGRYHSVFLKTDGTVWAAGLNDKGQLGDGTKTNQTDPVQIPSLNGIVAVAAGHFHSVFKSDGTAWAAGLNGSGQLGDGTDSMRAAPVQINTCNNAAGITDNKRNSNIVHVVPNPAKGAFVITSEYSKMENLIIYNIKGEKVFSQQSSAADKITVELPGKLQGVYFFKLQTNGQTINTGKIVLE